MFSNTLHRTFGITFALLATLSFTASDAQAQAKPKAKAQDKMEAGAAVNASVRLPMLAERVTKSYALLQQKTLEQRARRQMADAIKEFEKTMRSLQTGIVSSEIQDNYGLLEQLWGEFRGLTSAPATAASMAKLAEQNEEVVWIATKGSQLVVEHTKSTRSTLIATAGDARVLTQRLAKLYLLRAAGIRNNVIEADLKAANDQLRADLDTLRKAPQNTAQIKDELALADTQMGFLKGAVEELNRNQTSMERLEYVAKACDNILEVMDRVTRLYESVKG